jgi:hypothetical protein
VAVDVTLLIVIADAKDSRELARDNRVFRDDGDKVTLEIGTKIPHFSGHSKYLFNGRND